jgi:exosome complex component RRP42
MTSNSSGLRSGILISSSERQFILEGCRDNCRQDGRKRDEARSYCVVGSDSSSSSSSSFQYDSQRQQLQPPLVLSNGSARLLLPTGATDLVCSVRAELVQPALDRPNAGVLEIQIDTTQKGSRNSYIEELESTLSRLLPSHLVNLQHLCVVPSHYVWRLNIDLLIVAASGGSLVDACSLVIRAALRNVKLPSVSTLARNDPSRGGGGGKDDNKPELAVDADIAAAKAIPGVDQAPEVVTVTVLRCSSQIPGAHHHKPTTILLLDATVEEEACAFAQVHLALDRSNPSEPAICAIHKAGGGSLPFGLLQDVTALALQTSISTFTAENKHHLLQDHFLLEQ